MLYSVKDLFGMAKMGYARLPYIGEYREGTTGDSPIEIPDDELAQYSEITRKFYYKKVLNNSLCNTLSRKGIERFKDELWKHFDEYQNNNEPRYLEPKTYGKRRKLTQQEFVDIMYSELDKIDVGTMRELYFLSKKVRILNEMCKRHNLNYDDFVIEMDKKYEKDKDKI